MHVDFNQIEKRFGDKVALNIPSWSIEKGDLLGLAGSNGAGKTTFLRILLDLLLPTSGSVRLDGRLLAIDSSWRKRTGSYLDRSFLVEYLTIPEYLSFVGAAFGFTEEETNQRLAEFERFLPISRVDTTRLLRDLSTGNAKKVGILAALFPRPEFVVLDEPFANLDPPSQIRLKDELSLMAETHQTTMIISSHDLGHVTEICDRITLLDAGVVKRDIHTSEETLSELKDFFSGDRQTSAT
ncbi:MAG: ABC transporter ATP-binding protein [Bacteroidetes Order II. Incertae sedis bacterium]|nr:ABC transporter ATP-binding protein [Bacteroidetes Order II. bacterium]